MFQRKINNPFSLISFFVIALAYLLVHFIGYKARLSGFDFLLYLIIFLSGIGYTRKTLLLWFPDLTVALTLLALAFGTNLFYMVTMDYQLQSILLFSLYAMVVFLTAKWHEQQNQTYAVSLALGLGMIILLQPTGFFSLMIPLLWGVHDKESWKFKIRLLKNNQRQTNLFFICLEILVLPPILFWRISPGEIPLLSFTLPGVFIAFSSFLWNDLFSFDHGWLIYTPIMALTFIGFYFFAKKNRPLFYTVFLFCILDLFMETSWSKLGTIPVFGQVAFIPAYALLVLPMTSLIEYIHSGKMFSRILLSVVIMILILMNLFQTWQFSNWIIPHSGMTADKYSQVFGRTGVTEIKKMQMTGIEPDASLVLKDEEKFRKINLALYDFENPDGSNKSRLVSDHVKSGKMALAMDSAASFSPALDLRYKDFTNQQRVGMRITASVFAASLESLSGVNLVITSIHEGTNYRYKSLNLGNLKIRPGIWNIVSLDYLIPSDRYPDDQLVSYVWYTGKSRIYIDDLKFEAFELRK